MVLVPGSQGILVFAHAVAAAADVDDVAVVEQAIDERGRHDLVAEGGAPLFEALVRRQHGRGPFVACVDQLEEQRGAVLADGEVADLVDDEQGGMGQHLQAAARTSSAAVIPRMTACVSILAQSRSKYRIVRGVCFSQFPFSWTGRPASL